MSTAGHTAGPVASFGELRRINNQTHWCGEVIEVSPPHFRGPIANITSCIHIDGIGNDEAEANASLIAEAFNVAHETGLTPRQLAEQRAELLAALKAILRAAEDGDEMTAISLAEAAIAKAEGGAA